MNDMDAFLPTLTNQLAALWGRLSRLQRLALVALLLTGMGLIVAFLLWARTPDYAVAFSGLTEEDAGRIVEQLQASNIPYQLSGGGTILVPRDQVYEVRLAMARQGLPQGGNVGFELFSAPTLGMTEFSQQVNYQRALEGELARTIRSLNAVQDVRVHIVLPQPSLYTTQKQEPTASITLKLKPGRQIEPEQVAAIRHLVASSVEGLKPDNITIVDTEGTLLSTPIEDEAGLAAATALSTNQIQAQRAYEAAIEHKVQAMLDRVLGPNKSVVRVAAQLNWDQVETTSQVVTPTGAIRSSQTISETYAGTPGLAGGIPGSSSNLPGAPSYQTVISGTQGVLYNRNESTINYELGQTETRQVKAPGQVARLSLSVLVDGVTETQQLAALSQAVAAAAGIDPARGDQLSVDTLAFDRSYAEQQQAELSDAARQQDIFQYAQWAALGLVLLGLLWYVWRLFHNLRLQAAPLALPVPLPAPVPSLKLAGAPGAEADPSLRSGLRLSAAQETPAGLLHAPAPGGALEAGESPVSEETRPLTETEQIERHLLQLAQRQPEAIAQIIRTWLNERD